MFKIECAFITLNCHLISGSNKIENENRECVKEVTSGQKSRKQPKNTNGSSM